LINKPNIIIGTIAKVTNIINNKEMQKNISTLVIDEIDMLINFGSLSEIDKICSLLPKKCQIIACSATLHESFGNKLKNFFTNSNIVTTSDSI
jgi:superfamily II DNA/RNA helicase